MKYRNPNPTPNKYEIYFGLLILLACLWAEAAHARPVEYNPADSPIAVKEMERAVQQALWQHSSRYRVDFTYAGTTGETLVDDKIIIRWEHLTYRLRPMLAKPVPGLAAHYSPLLDFNELTGRMETLGYAYWFTRIADGSFVKGEIVINIDTAPESVDTCLMETLDHELGHIFRGTEGHSDNKDDVMYPYRGDCRYSLSLSDIQFIGKPLTSCHVELTPDSDLEALDVRGQRVALTPLGNSNSLERANLGMWIWKHIDPNPKPQFCDGVVVDGKDIFAEVKAFGLPTVVIHLKMDSGLFRLVK